MNKLPLFVLFMLIALVGYTQDKAIKSHLKDMVYYIENVNNQTEEINSLLEEAKDPEVYDVKEFYTEDLVLMLDYLLQNFDNLNNEVIDLMETIADCGDVKFEIEVLKLSEKVGLASYPVDDTYRSVEKYKNLVSSNPEGSYQVPDLNDWEIYLRELNTMKEQHIKVLEFTFKCEEE